jgi:hypothetical protein
MTTTQQAESLVAKVLAVASNDSTKTLFIRELATYGWPKDATLSDDSFELRCAIQDYAKTLEASL